MLKVDKLIRRATFYEKLALGIDGRLLFEFNKFLNFHNLPSITEDQLNEWFTVNESIMGSKRNQMFDYQTTYLCSTYYSHKLALYDLITIDTKIDPVMADFFASSYYTGDIINEYMLSPSNGIPKLFLYTVKRINGTNPSKDLSKEMSHNSFIAETIYNWFGTPDEEINAFYENNKSAIDNLRRFISGRPKYLGGGVDGRAYDIGNGLVLKFFNDETAYKAALQSMRRLHTDPALGKTEAMIYDVGILGVIYDKPIYYYIMQKMIPASSKLPGLSRIASFIGTHVMSLRKQKLQAMKKYIDDPEYKDRILEEIKRLVVVIKERIRNDLFGSKFADDELNKIKNDGDLKDNWLELFIEEILVKYLTSRTDLHLGNLGITNSGELRYFDPTYKNWTSKLNLGIGS